MAPTNADVMELVYASKLLAKTLDEVDEKAAILIAKVETLQAAENSLRELVSSVDKKLEILPLVIAGKLEDLVERRVTEAFEDLRVTLDEMRNKLWALKKDVKSVKDQTGSHILLPKKEEEKEDGVEIRKGGFRMNLPFSEGTWKVLKIVIYIVVAIAGTMATSGGIWALVDRLKHLPGGE
jgi:hypothetical protein